MFRFWLRSVSRKSEPAPSRRHAARAAVAESEQSSAGNLAVGRSPGRVRQPVRTERQADKIAQKLSLGQPIAGRGERQIPEPVLPPPNAGRALSRNLLPDARAAVGDRADQLRVHDGTEARDTAALLGARAFYDGGNIWLGPNAGEYDRELLLHELGHAAQGEAGVYLRAATWLERRAWLGFFDHYLPRKFLNNYMDDTGTPITLTQQEMIDVNPVVNIARSRGFQTELASLQTLAKSGTPAVRYIDVKGPGQAKTNGTLGNFTIHYRGVLTVTSTGDWTFSGVMSFYDVWDFDPKPFGTSGRSPLGELKTRVAAEFLPGKPFEIFSVDTPCTQTSSDPRAVWAGGTPHFVNDRLGRAGADIDVGAVGGVGLGPVGIGVGGEVGAQGAEDINP